MKTPQNPFPALHKYANFDQLSRRTLFPRNVRSYLRGVTGITGMVQFLSRDTLNRLTMLKEEISRNEKNRRGPLHRVFHRAYEANPYGISMAEIETAIGMWHLIRTAAENKINPPTQPETGETEMSRNNNHMSLDDDDNLRGAREQLVNADRNEMIALLQHAKGAAFVSVACSGNTFVYKAVKLDLAEGDIVVVQVRDHVQIGTVTAVLPEPPTSDEYDYRKPMKHVVQKVDMDRDESLRLLDKNMLKRITSSEAQDRLSRLTAQLGISLDSITLDLPSPDSDSDA